MQKTFPPHSGEDWGEGESGLAGTRSVYEAIKDELLTKQEGLRWDVGLFFSLPVPKAVWQRTKLLQNQDFAAFIDSSLKN